MSYEAGRKAEYVTRRYLEAQGYSVIRSAGSKGMWDLVGIGGTSRYALPGCADVVLANVKRGEWPRPAERRALEAFQSPGVQKLMFRWTTLGAGQLRAWDEGNGRWIEQAVTAPKEASDGRDDPIDEAGEAGRPALLPAARRGGRARRAL